MNATRRPLASVVIDNFNYARFLPEAIDTALAQTYPNVEVIVVDDGSTDDSRDVIAGYGGSVRPVLKRNGGQASAFNAGFEASGGEVVLFLDSDDRLSPVAIERAVDALASDAAAVKVQWQMEAIDAAGFALGRHVPGRAPSEGDLRAVVARNGPSSIVSSPTSGNAWRRSFLSAVLPAPTDVPYYRRSADEYLFTLAAASGTVRNIPESLGQYRVHGESHYSAKSFDQKLAIELDGYDAQCEVLRRFLQARGRTVDTGRWQTASWWHRLERAVRLLRHVVPPDESVILIDDGTWGIGPNDRPTTVPFAAHDGIDWGPPANDEAAVVALDAHRESGVRYLAVAWAASWWLEHYAGLARHLRTHASLLVNDDALQLFQLAAPTRAEGVRA